MGTFIGHATPGIMFILYAIWNVIKQAYTRVKLAEDSAKYPINSKLCGDGRYKKIPQTNAQRVQDVPLFRHDRIVEGAFFLACSGGGAFGMVAYGRFRLLGHNGAFSENLNNWQHGTMFAFYGIYFTIVILGQTKHRLEPEMEKLFHSMPFFVEAFLFYFHLHDRTQLDVHLHHLLVLSIMGSAVCLFAQAWNPGDPLLENMWVVFCLLHGMWFFMIGFVLYNPVYHGNTSWNHSDEHMSVMMVTVMYTWQFLLALIMNSVVRWIVWFAVHRRRNGDPHQLGERIGSKFNQSNSDGATEMANLLDDEAYEGDNGL